MDTALWPSHVKCMVICSYKSVCHDQCNFIVTMISVRRTPSHYSGMVKRHLRWRCEGFSQPIIMFISCTRWGVLRALPSLLSCCFSLHFFFINLQVDFGFQTSVDSGFYTSVDSGFQSTGFWIPKIQNFVDCGFPGRGEVLCTYLSMPPYLGHFSNTYRRPWHWNFPAVCLQRSLNLHFAQPPTATEGNSKQMRFQRCWLSKMKCILWICWLGLDREYRMVIQSDE